MKKTLLFMVLGGALGSGQPPVLNAFVKAAGPTVHADERTERKLSFVLCKNLPVESGLVWRQKYWGEVQSESGRHGGETYGDSCLSLLVTVMVSCGPSCNASKGGTSVHGRERQK